MIKTQVYKYTPKNTGVRLEHSANGAVLEIPREEIIDVARRMLTIYENTTEEKCPMKDD